MISRRHKFVFLHSPKTGGRSIIKLFSEENLHYDKIQSKIRKGDTETDIELGHRTVEQLMRDFPEYKDYTRFTVFRDPFERMVSWYLYSTKRETPSKEGFVEFLKTEGSQIKPQIKYIDEKTTVIDFKNFEQEIIQLIETLKLTHLKDVEIPKLNSVSMDRKFHEFYNSESESLVRNYYKDDFEFMKKFKTKSKLV